MMFGAGSLFASTNASAQPLKLVKRIRGGLSPKSVVHNGRGLFFAQNMMYSHTIHVYNRGYQRIRTLRDTVVPAQFGVKGYDRPLKGAPVECAFSHDGRYAWISNYQMYGPGFARPGHDRCDGVTKCDPSFLYRVDTRTLRIDAVVQVGAVPKFVAATPDSRLVLVTNWCTYDMSVVDTAKLREVRRVKLGRFPRGIAVTPDGRTAYAALLGGTSIAKVDLQTWKVTWIRDVGLSPRHLVLSPDARYLYATLNGASQVARVETASGRVLRVRTGSQPRTMAMTADGKRLFVVNNADNSMSVVQAPEMKVLQTLKTGGHPIGVTVDDASRRVWVACYHGEIDVFAW
jgi:YVTN family beta-propeller protein